MKRTFLASLVAALSMSAYADADAIYFGGDILTMDDTMPKVEAVAIKDGKIVAVGKKDAIKAEHKDANTALVDLEGQTLMPSFFDAHSHFQMSGVKLAMVNLDPKPAGNIDSIKDIQREMSWALSKRDKDSKDWLIGWGYDNAMLEEGRHPTRHDLDAISTDVPIIAIHFSTHIIVANTYMLEMLGIDENSVAPSGGVIQREEGSMQPNGILEEAAIKPILLSMTQDLGVDQSQDLPQDFMFELSQKMVRDAQDVYASQGFTTVTELGLSPQTQALFQHMAATNQLKVDVAGGMFYFATDVDTVVDNYSPEYNNGYRLAGLKANLDGGSPGRTAYLRDPYHVQLEGEQDYVGYSSMTADDLAKLASTYLEHDIPLFVHALGDGALDIAIEGLSVAKKAQPGEDRRTQLIHLQQIQEDQFESLKDLDVTLTYQMAHSFYFADFHAKNIYGPERTAKLNPVQSGINHGFSTTIHHDSPVHPVDQFTLIWTAVNRVSRSGKVWGEDERISVMDALKASTINAAYQFREENQKGSLEVGKLADMIILDQNPLDIDPMKLKDLQVMATFKEGVEIFRAK
ncbi:amidohydrolase [Vibrio sp. WXL210]|uniref:amidohydrolase n=1 Tax=Vibrio sp. WXL210 TaxID=3450709 RepID=UPI003EC65E1F